jgi:hypothetical protein
MGFFWMSSSTCPKDTGRSHLFVVEQTAHFFDPSFLKVSVDQFSQNRYIRARNPQGGGADISSFSGEKSLGSEEKVRFQGDCIIPRPDPKAMTPKPTDIFELGF